MEQQPCIYNVECTGLLLLFGKYSLMNKNEDCKTNPTSALFEADINMDLSLNTGSHAQTNCIF